MRLRVVDEHYDSSRFPPGARPADGAKMFTYKPDVFGTPCSYALQRVMRGPSEWTVGEREVMGAFVSQQNQCPFCASTHAATAAAAMGDPRLVHYDGALREVLVDGPNSDSISPRLRMTLRFLERLTREPEALSAADAEEVRRAGVGEAALVDAIHVAALFNMVNRLANALDFELIERPLDAPNPLLELGYAGIVGLPARPAEASSR